MEVGSLIWCCYRTPTGDEVERHRARMRANLVRLPEPVGWLITRAEAGAVISLFVAAVGFYGAIKLASQGSQDGHSP